MLKIAICDDNINELERTFCFVSSFATTRPENDCSIRRFQSSYDLLESVDSGINYNIYILDVIMPILNGIDVGTSIRKVDEQAIIIYMTTSPDYAVKSYKVFAFQYLLKPVKEQDLINVLDKAIDSIEYNAAQHFPVKTKQGLLTVRYHHIVFIEYTNHVLNFHLFDGTKVTSVIMRESFDVLLKNILKDCRFIKTHASYVINLDFVSAILKKDFVTNDQQLIPISKNIYTDVKTQYIDFLLEGGK